MSAPQSSEAEAVAPLPETHAGIGDFPVLLIVRGLTALVFVVALVIGAHYYLGQRIFEGSGLPGPIISALWVAMWGAFLSILVAAIGGRFLPRRLVLVPTWVGFLWMGAFGLLLVTALASDVLVGALSLVLERQPHWVQVQAWAIPVVVGPALLLGVRAARGTPRVERLTVPIRGLGKELDGFRIVQITDIHIGETLHRRHLQRIVDQVNALAPDAVAVTGDLVDGTPRHLGEDIEPLGELKGKHGVYFVTGNHEYYHGGPAWERHVAKLGLTVLHNSHRVVEVGGAKLVIGGVPDLEAGNFLPEHAPDAGKAFAGAPQGAPRVLLAHQPRFAKKAQGHEVQLQLSGHTHGGQIFPFMFFVRLQQPVISGFHTLWGVPVYTSKGTGYWGPPVRVGTSCEVTEITLRAV
jgi:uncharacterized protein